MSIRIYQCESQKKFPFNALALLIQHFSKTNYSHYALSYDGILYYDSTGHGTRVSTAKTFTKKYKIKTGFICRRAISEREFNEWFGKHEGKGYGFGQIVGLALKIIGIIKNNPFGRGKKRIICNELVVLFLNRFYAAKVKDTDSLDLNDTQELILKVKI